MKYFLLALKNYAQFSGRATRSEYWYFVLFQLIFGIAAALLDNVLGLTFTGIPYGFIYLSYGLALILPALAVGVRRLHDVNKSGWFILISLIPLIGGIWLLIVLIRKGTSGENRYGPDPTNPGPTFDFEAQEA